MRVSTSSSPGDAGAAEPGVGEVSMREIEVDVARRTLHLLDKRSTTLAPHILEEPVEGYSSPEQFHLERRAIFNRYPMFMGLSCELAAPGSWMTSDASGTPMLLTRDGSGKVRAFLNMCQHRGVRVVDGRGEGTRRFVCPFHAWVYDLEGELVGVPGAEGFTEMCRGERGLVELPAEERYGMIFASANAEAPFSIDSHLGELAAHFASFGFETWTPIVPVHPHQVTANWKVIWGTHCETYHFAHLHRNTAGPLAYGYTSVADFYGDHALMTSTMRSIDHLRALPESEWRPVADGHINFNYRLFPNLSISVVQDRLEIYAVYPEQSIDRTVSLHYTYQREPPKSEDERKRVGDQVYWACQSVVDKEDYAVAARTEPGLRSPSAPETLVFGRNEPVMQHMARTLRRVLDGTREPI